MNITKEEAKQKVDALYELSASQLNSWEADFIEDMTDITEFTDNQLEKIEELYKKHCE